MTNWKIEICSTKPLELQVIAPNTYMQRKNIHEVIHENLDDMSTYILWECESREVSFEEYYQIITDEKIETQQAQIDYIAMMTDLDLEV